MTDIAAKRPDRAPEDAVVVPDERPAGAAERGLGDFQVSRRLLGIVGIACVVGAAVAGVALGLLDLIALLTHLAYTGHVGTELGRPDTRVLGPFSVVVPVVGGLVVGAMAKYGSERIRGHGIPEAMETILLRGSRMEPRLAVLKPISSAVSIGSGGPFGAEGPIIVTGGAVGSIVGQLLHLTAVERRSLLVAGAAGGMTAVFGTPVAGVLLAVELLLFEFRPRSLVPAAAAAATAEVVREGLASAGLLKAVPLFPVPPHVALGPSADAGALVIGLACAALAWVMTRAVYASEDAFSRLPVHWAWWPAIGGVVVGIGGLIEPRALGVGYDVIGDLLTNRLAIATVVSVLLVKMIIWAVALGSNTSGGVLAPLLMLGAALGGLLGHVLPGASPATFALLGMAATLTGVMRSPFTSIVFAVELTHDVGVLLPLLIACAVAHLASVLGLPRSILTEKIARRGFHVSREMAVDPLQALFVREVMADASLDEVHTVRPDDLLSELYRRMPEHGEARRQRLFPVLRDDVLLGVLTWSDILGAKDDPGLTAGEVARAPEVVHPDQTLRQAADTLVSSGRGVLPVVDAGAPQRLRGLLTQFDLLRAHERVLVEERHRERPLRLLGRASSGE